MRALTGFEVVGCGRFRHLLAVMAGIGLVCVASPVWAQFGGAPAQGGGGFGGSGGFGDFAQGFGSGNVGVPGLVSSFGSELVLVPSQSGKTWWGYSGEKGSWSKLSVPEGQGPGTPVLSANVAVVMFKRSVAGFAPKTGQWAIFEAPADYEGALMPVLGNRVAACACGKRLAAFSGLTGTWSVVETSEALPPVIGAGETISAGNAAEVHFFSAKTGTWASVDLTVD